MARVKKFLDIDVLTAAKDRIRHTYELFDSVAVCYSGGKDSLAALHLTREIAEERGRLPVDVIFRDEELIPDQVVDFVDEYRKLPWVKMLYFAVPLKSHKYILGKTAEYVQWDPGRPHIRPVPPHAITLPAGDSAVVARRCLPEILGPWPEHDQLFANVIADAAAREVFIEGRVKTVRAVNRLCDVDKEAAVLASRFDVANRRGSCLRLTLRESRPEETTSAASAD